MSGSIDPAFQARKRYESLVGACDGAYGAMAQSGYVPAMRENFRVAYQNKVVAHERLLAAVRGVA